MATMPLVVGKLYVESNIKRDTKKNVKKIVENVRTEFLTMIKNAHWMDSQSQSLSIEKATHIDLQVAYPEFIFNTTYLDLIYNDVT